MQRDKFLEFWNKYSQEWYTTTFVCDDKNNIAINELCVFRKDSADIVYTKYEFIKNVVKESYFKNVDPNELKPCRISRYKRAAVLTYAIINSNPLIFKNKKSDPWIDPYFLKQKLAFYLAIGSIVQDATNFSIEKCQKQNIPVFDFISLGKSDKNTNFQDDSFLTSVYKDLLFSEIYSNFNVLTMANLYGLLTEKASNLEFEN